MLLVIVVCVVFSIYLYCQALANGMAKKRWAFAGLLFGPLIWPMFQMQIRMKVYRMFGMNGLILKA